MVLTERDRDALEQRANDGDIHIVDSNANPWDAMVYRALCGQAGVMWEDGSITPEWFDFYLLHHGHEKATCSTCVALAVGREHDSATCDACECSRTVDS